MPHLDKYAAYVLVSYGIALAIIVGLTLWSVLRLAAAKKKLDRLGGEDES